MIDQLHKRKKRKRERKTLLVEKLDDLLESKSFIFFLEFFEASLSLFST